MAPQPFVHQQSNQDRDDIKIEDIEDGEKAAQGSSGSSAINKENIQRKDDNPHMFYRVPTVPDPQPTPACVIPPPALNLLRTTRTIVKMNIISLISIGLMLPVNIINIYVFITGASCETDFEFFLKTRYVFFYMLVCVILYPFLIQRKLHHFSNSYV